MPWILTMVDTQAKEGELPYTSGHQIYNQLCAACHGIDFSGDPTRTIPSLEGVQHRRPRQEALDQLETGKGIMPSSPSSANASEKVSSPSSMATKHLIPPRKPPPGAKPSASSPSPIQAITASSIPMATPPSNPRGEPSMPSI
ncbi:MAG: c-type cytochrome [Limisphaerales bacterium]